jgi:hypothetical protein
LIPCKRPEICFSGKLCSNTKTDHCCWHEDQRKNKNIHYVDMYGMVNFSRYGVILPPDIHYCPTCKITTHTISDFIGCLPPIDYYVRPKESNRPHVSKSELYARQRNIEYQQIMLRRQKIIELLRRLDEKARMNRY